MRFALSAFLFTVLFSCSEVEPEPLTPDLVTEVRAYDLGNNGDASDIRVDFDVRDNLNVEEYRILVVPTNAGNLDLTSAAALPPPNYMEVLSEPFTTDYSVSRLTEDLLDVTGSPIQNDRQYEIVILVKGTREFQLSDDQSSLSLEDQPTLTGQYLISFYAECDYIDGSSGPSPGVGNRQAGTLFILDLQAIGDKYSSDLRCSDCLPGFEVQGRMVFEFDGPTVTAFTWEWASHLCPDPNFVNCDEGAPCAAMSSGQGTIVEELHISVVSTYEDCTSTCAEEWYFERQAN